MSDAGADDALHSRLRALLLVDEGVRLRVYDDATGLALVPGVTLKGHPTIGIGRALDTRGLTASEVEVLLANDIEAAIAEVRRRWPWSRGVSEARQAVLASMVFQLGAAGAAAFTGTLEAASHGAFDRAATMMLESKWATQTPARARRLAQMMREG